MNIRRLLAIRSPWDRISHRLDIGHRAAFLLLFGLIYIALGVGIVLEPGSPMPDLFHTRLPVIIRVVLWCGCGTAAAIAAKSVDWQWLGFAFLVPPAMERALSYAIAVVMGFFEGAPPLWPRLNGMLLYLLILATVRLVASWPDPPSVKVRVPKGGFR